MTRTLFGACRGLALFIGLGLASASMAADYRSVAESATVLYDAPSSKGRRLFVLGAGYPLEVIVSVEGWTKVRDSAGTIGWVEAPALGPKRMVVVMPSVAEVRTAPEAGAAVAFKVARNVLLEWVETLPSGWTRVRHTDAGQGFLPSSELWGS